MRGLGWKFDAGSPQLIQVKSRSESPPFQVSHGQSPEEFSEDQITRADPAFSRQGILGRALRTAYLHIVLIQISKGRGRLYKCLETSNSPTKDET